MTVQRSRAGTKYIFQAVYIFLGGKMEFPPQYIHTPKDPPAAAVLLRQGAEAAALHVVLHRHLGALLGAQAGRDAAAGHHDGDGPGRPPQLGAQAARPVAAAGATEHLHVARGHLDN